jgi:hypothetical protein
MLTRLLEVRHMATVRVDEGTLAIFRELARKDGATPREVTARAARKLRHEEFLDAADEAYRQLREDPEEWAAELEERRFWDAVVADRPRQP